MKKRAIIAIFLTAGGMFVAHKLWHHAPVLVFISFLILSFLLSYKITDYIADFKTVKHNSRIDIIFLLIFFILLCIPASHISKEKMEKDEFRTLAEKPLLIDKNARKKLNLKYGNEFNEFFNDRFYLRRKMIQLNIAVKCTLNTTYCGNKKYTFYKKGNLIYSGSYFGLPKIRKNKQEVLEAYADNVNKLQKFCDDRNIKLYILVVPRQADFFNYPLADIRNYRQEQAEEVLEYLKNNTKTVIIYPKAEMTETNKETPVYFKTDHHWTKKGAYIGYRELMKEIQKDFPSIPVVEESSLEKYYDNRVSGGFECELDNGQSFLRLGLPNRYAKKILDTPYLYYKNPSAPKLQKDVKLAPIIKIGQYEDCDNQFYYPDGLDKKVMVIGNSFAGNLVEFLPYSFKYTIRYFDNFRYMKLATYEEVFDRYQPDVLVLNFQTQYTARLLNLYPNKFTMKEAK